MRRKSKKRGHIYIWRWRVLGGESIRSSKYIWILSEMNRGKKLGEYRKHTFTPEVIDKINYLITALIK